MGSTLICSDCHTMHYSISHSYTGGAGEVLTGAPHVGLLKGENADAMCLSCHDGKTFAPDVLGANTGTNVREAGGLTTSVAPYENWKGHTLGVPGLTAPGGTYTTGEDGLECLNCHAQHGQGGKTGDANGQFRNLLAKPGTATVNSYVTYAKVTNDPTKDVFERDPSLGQVATHYSVDNVDFNEPDITKSAYGDWCKGCHTVFHGAENEGTKNNWYRHPTAGVRIGLDSPATYYSSLARFKGLTNHVKVMNPNGKWDMTENDFVPSCFSCHKAHGNQNAFGLIYMQGTGTVTEQGDSGTQYKNLCRQCHQQGTDT